LEQLIRMKAVRRDGHTMVAQSLKALGVTHVYCVAGTPVRETFARCAAVGIRPIGVRHQQAGVLMATAQNYCAGRLTAVAIVSAGPAVTNAATGLLVARDNCWPTVVLGGRRPLAMQGMGSFQELDGVALYRSITKWCALVETTASIPAYLERAFRVAMEGRPGPVYLDLPEDVLTGLAVAEPVPQENRQPEICDHAAICKAADLLLGAERPALIVGKGVRWSEPYDELERLVDDFGIPFMTSPMGRGFLPDDHPLCFNDARGVLQAAADAILLVGARLDWTFRFGSELARDARLIQVDIHEPEIGVNRTPAVGIQGDARRFLERLVATMRARRGRSMAARESWCALLEEKRKERRNQLQTKANDDAIPMSPYRMLKEIREFLPRRGVISILDGNVFMAAAEHVFPAYEPLSRFTAGSNGCMGVGIPFALGAKIAAPERMVIAVCGDTATGMSAMEMETAVRHRIAIIVVVVNNEGMGGALNEKALFPASDQRITMFQPDIRYDAIMRHLGGHGESVERPADLKPALARAAAAQRPACINVRVDPHAAYPS
jgi:thiamine pyrophosphate-dependent acetolactate synthase large subunit-like protein